MMQEPEYTVTFSDGSTVNFNAGCDSYFADKVVSSANLRMNSGGGGDNNIRGDVVAAWDMTSLQKMSTLG